MAGTMITRRIKSVLAALLSAYGLVCTAPPQAAALEFHCVEPSRYKNLFQIFEDNPSTFFTYFNISRRPLPPPDSCRALVVTGTIDHDSAGALLNRIIEGRGWLAALYLSFDGTNLEQEAAMASLVRSVRARAWA